MDQTLTSSAHTTPTEPSSPLVSIALSVFNGAPQLRDAIQSVINQTLTRWELIVLDDGSSDDSVAIVQSFADPRIRLIRDGLNLGLAARLNQAIDLARSPYFARMDHDDICHPERLARQLAFLQDHPTIDLLSTECVTMNEASILNGRLPTAHQHQEICRRPWLGFYMPHPTWMGKITWFRQHRYASPAPYCSEDQELLLRTHTNSTFQTYPEALLAYRVRSYTPWKKLWRTRLSLCRVQLRYFRQQQQWYNASLSIIVTLLRLTSDVLRGLKHHVKPSAKQPQKSGLNPTDQKIWQQAIQVVMQPAKSRASAPENSND